MANVYAPLSLPTHPRCLGPCYWLPSLHVFIDVNLPYTSYNGQPVHPAYPTHYVWNAEFIVAGTTQQWLLAGTNRCKQLRLHLVWPSIFTRPTRVDLYADEHSGSHQALNSTRSPPFWHWSLIDTANDANRPLTFGSACLSRLYGWAESYCSNLARLPSRTHTTVSAAHCPTAVVLYFCRVRSKGRVKDCTCGLPMWLTVATVCNGPWSHRCGVLVVYLPHGSGFVSGVMRDESVHVGMTSVIFGTPTPFAGVLPSRI